MDSSSKRKTPDRTSIVDLDDTPPPKVRQMRILPVDSGQIGEQIQLLQQELQKAKDEQETMKKRYAEIESDLVSSKRCLEFSEQETRSLFIENGTLKTFQDDVRELANTLSLIAVDVQGSVLYLVNRCSELERAKSANERKIIASYRLNAPRCMICQYPEDASVRSDLKIMFRLGCDSPVPHLLCSKCVLNLVPKPQGHEGNTHALSCPMCRGNFKDVSLYDMSVHPAVLLPEFESDYSFPDHMIPNAEKNPITAFMHATLVALAMHKRLDNGISDSPPRRMVAIGQYLLNRGSNVIVADGYLESEPHIPRNLLAALTSRDGINNPDCTVCELTVDMFGNDVSVFLSKEPLDDIPSD